MSILKFPPLSLLVPRPRRASRTLLPAGAAAALALLAALQIGWSRPALLPLPEAITPVRLPAVFLPPLPVPVAGRALFGAGPVTAAVAQPLNVARAAGVARQGGRALAFLQGADGRVTTIGLGQSYAGWQWVGIGVDGLRFRRGGESATLALGAGPASVAAAGAER